METKPDLVYSYIKTRIVDNTYKPSQRLVESELAQEIGTSRNAIRIALSRLEQENLVVIEKNKGAYVKSFTLEEVLNVLEIRELLERLIARNAVEHITEQQLEELSQILQEMRRCLEEGRYDDYSKNNGQFHEVIYSASNKKEAIELVKQLKTQIVRHQFRTILVSDRSYKSIEEHTAIYEALKNRDVEAVDAAIQQHVSNVAKTIHDFYEYLI